MRTRDKHLLLVLAALWLWPAEVTNLEASTNAAVKINPPLGPYIHLSASDFAGVPSYSITNRLVVTPYFYWYDVYSNAHILNSDGSDALTDHPATLTGFSYLSSAWHRTQLRDLTDAGIDVMLPVYWGEPSQRLAGRPVSAQPWSFAGVPPLVQAREDCLAQGQPAPRIGLFYDTSTLQYNAVNKRIDLTTSYGREWFYETVRDYFSLLPPRHWALIEGKPLLFLYSSAFAAQYDQGCIDYLRANFARDFGGRQPYVVREVSWNVRTEQVYAWGGALGLKNPGVASLGPGYDHSAVPGRAPLIVPRENGGFFERNWEAFLSRPSLVVCVETWNEFHEGTDIANSREYGRQYIDLNRKYAAMFKAGVKPPRPAGPYTNARLIEMVLGATNVESGLKQFEFADGATVATNQAGLPCRAVAPTSSAGRYVYFKVDDSFKWADTMDVSVVVDYFDGAPGSLRLEFDGSDLNAPLQGAYTASPESVALTGSRTWRKAVFSLRAARFRNLQNGGADFRLNSAALGLAVRRVQVLRPGLRADKYLRELGCYLTLFAEPGRRYAIQTSTNLIDWSPLNQLQIVEATTPFVDGLAAALARRWYRAIPSQ